MRSFFALSVNSAGAKIDGAYYHSRNFQIKTEINTLNRPKVNHDFICRSENVEIKFPYTHSDEIF